MTVEQIQLRCGDFRSVHRRHVGDFCGEFFSAKRLHVAKAGWPPSFFQVQAVTAEKADARSGDLVVHDGVPHVALQPAFGFAPDFADDVDFGVDGSHAATEFSPEFVVVNFVGDVESPAVDSEFHPVCRNRQQEFSHSRAVCVELWQRGQVPPRGIADRFVTALP